MIARRSVPPDGGSGSGDIHFDAVDRYLVPRDVPEAMAHLADRLFVSHGTEERLRRRLATAAGPAAARGLLAQGAVRLSAGADRLESDGSEGAEETVGRWRPALPLLRALGRQGERLIPQKMGGAPLHRSVLLRDYHESGRERLIAFPFRRGEDRPAAVVKLRPARHPGESLRAERDAMESVRSALPPALAATLPAALSFAEADGAEILVLGHVEGRSAYWYQQNLLLPSRSLIARMQASAGWLAGFHRALGADVRAGPGPAHGDFWARNVLLAPTSGGATVTGVVDWEGFRARGQPLHDLFHFPLTYGLNQPGGRRGHRPLHEVFRAAFLEPTHVWTAVNAYLSRYCAETDLDPRDLLTLCHRYVELMICRAEADAGTEWAACRTLIENFPRPVLSRCDPSSS